MTRNFRRQVNFGLTIRLTEVDVVANRKELGKRQYLSRVRRWLHICFGLLLLSGCIQKPTVERDFPLQALLVDVSVFPIGWDVGSGPREVEDHISGTYDSWYLNFHAETDAPRDTAAQHVYRYPSSKIAQSVYEDIVLRDQFGEILPDDTCGGLTANQSRLTCYDYEGRDQVNCEWSGLYEEHIITFGSWLIPDRMTLEDMQSIICAIDAHVERCFAKNSENCGGE